MSTDFGPLQTALFDQLSVPCAVQRGVGSPMDSRCIVEDGVAQIGEYGQIIGRVRRLNFIKSEWDPARGDIVTLDAVAQRVETIDDDDGLVVKVTVNA